MLCPNCNTETKRVGLGHDARYVCGAHKTIAIDPEHVFTSGGNLAVVIPVRDMSNYRDVLRLTASQLPVGTTLTCTDCRQRAVIIARQPGGYIRVKRLGRA